jgi:branched-chain amino acid transport system ATP-binding protein
VTAAPVLRVDGVRKRFGGLVAVDGVTFDVGASEIVGLIGPNGAGKTTLFNLISGQLHPDDGRVMVKGDDVTGLPPQARAARGLARTFQKVRLFAGMTVLEHAMVGCHVWSRRGMASAIFGAPSPAAEEREIRRVAAAVVDRVGLADVADTEPDEIARALAQRPTLLLMDEPAAGLNTYETRALATTIRAIRDGGVTTVLVEHDMDLVMDVCDRIVVLNFGAKIAEGRPAEVRTDQRVLDAYLGVAGWRRPARVTS